MPKFEASAAAGTINESESNNTPATADVTYDNYGYISSSSDVDWWKVVFSSNGIATFWLGSIPSGTNYNIELYDSDGTSRKVYSNNSGSVMEYSSISNIVTGTSKTYSLAIG